MRLPRRHPRLQDVEVYLGWAGRRSRRVQLAGLALRPLTITAPGRALAHALTPRAVSGSSGGPDAQARARARTLVVAEALRATGQCLARVQLEGPNPYELTGELLAWAATAAASQQPLNAGVLGPAELFGLDPLEAACRSIGLIPRP